MNHLKSSFERFEFARFYLNALIVLLDVLIRPAPTLYVGNPLASLHGLRCAPDGVQRPKLPVRPRDLVLKNAQS